MDEEKLKREIEEKTKNVTEEDLKKTLEKSDEILNKVKSSSVLEREFMKVRILIMMLEDYINGEYEEIPWGTVASLVVALMYILSPIDLVPDFIPVIGLMDDLAVLLIVWAGISSDVRKYYEWKSQRDENFRLAYADVF